MSYCFTEHGILPSEFKEIPFEDKAIMIAALQDLSERQEQAMKKARKKAK